MKYFLLGQSGLRVSGIALGTATFGVAPLEEDADALIGNAIDLGCNLIDTANSYGNQSRFDRPGAPAAALRASAEEIIGRALKGRRQDIVLCSKVSEPVGDLPNQSGLSRAHIFGQVETSLRRLQTDHLDVYYAHHPDPNTPIEQTIRAFEDLIRQGKVRHFALSTFSAWEMTEALWVSEKIGAGAPVCNQLSYSLGNRAIEDDLTAACLKFGVSVVAFSPLAGGLLAGEDALNRTIIGAKRFGYDGFSANQLSLARRFNDIANEWSIAPATLAVAWLLSQRAVASAIIGAETIAEFSTAAAAGDMALDPALRCQLDEIGKPAPRQWY